MIKMRLIGEKNLIRALHRKERRYAHAMQVAVLNGATFVLRESNEVVPVDKGRLRDSGYALRSGSGLGSVGTVGYRKDYGIWVHEDLTKAHGEAYNIKHAADIAAGNTYDYEGERRTYRPRRPQERAKFLEFAIRTKRRALQGVVRNTFYRNAVG